MLGFVERFPGLPAGSYILRATDGVRAKVIDACRRCGLAVRPLREYVEDIDPFTSRASQDGRGLRPRFSTYSDRKKHCPLGIGSNRMIPCSSVRPDTVEPSASRSSKPWSETGASSRSARSISK